MSRSEFICVANNCGVFQAALEANTCGVPLAQVQLWLRQMVFVG